MTITAELDRRALRILYETTQAVIDNRLSNPEAAEQLRRAANELHADRERITEARLAARMARATHYDNRDPLRFWRSPRPGHVETARYEGGALEWQASWMSCLPEWTGVLA